MYLVPICICVVLPVLIVWLVGRVKQNETNRRTEIMLKALDNSEKIDADFFRSLREEKSLKKKLLSRLTSACITSLIGVAFLANGFLNESIDKGQCILAGGILLAVGIALFIVYFCGKKLMAKEIEAEEKQLTEEK